MDKLYRVGFRIEHDGVFAGDMADARRGHVQLMLLEPAMGCFRNHLRFPVQRLEDGGAQGERRAAGAVRFPVVVDLGDRRVVLGVPLHEPGGIHDQLHEQVDAERKIRGVQQSGILFLHELPHFFQSVVPARGPHDDVLAAGSHGSDIVEHSLG